MSGNDGIPRLKNGKYWIKGNWPLIMRTLLEFPDKKAPSIRELAIKAGKGSIHWGIIHRWHTIPESLVSRKRRGRQIELGLTELGMNVVHDLSISSGSTEQESQT